MGREPEEGFVVLCDSNGIALNILLDRTGITPVLRPGQPLALIFDPISVEKALQFMQSIRRDQAAFDWELNVNLRNEIVTMFFAGGLYEDQLLVVGSPSRNGVMLSFYEELMRINHEQNNQLRNLLKIDSLQARGEATPDSALYHEFTQVNNRLVNIQRELTKRNAQLQAEHERQRIISELVSDYAYAFTIGPSGDLYLEWITEAYTRITGYAIEAINAAPDGWLTHLYPGAEAAVRRHFEVCLHGEPDRCELQITTQSGDTRFLRVNCQPVRDATTGRVARLYGAAQDITQRVRADQQTRALELERQRSQILAEFIQDALHEFRTPLSSIKTATYVLSVNPDSSPREQEAIARLRSQTDAIQDLVEALATMARLDGGEAASGRMMLAPDAMLEQICDTFRNEAQAAQLALTLTLEPDLPALYANYQNLALAMAALLRNAIRFTPPGGAIHVVGQRQGDTVIISVQDRGIGIAPEDLPHIFERFWRKDKARTQRGFGLGLPIARKIAESHQGRIEVESALGAGSTFRLILPVHRPASP